ncbi:MAG: NAD(P)H-hydrate dehydratase, partial [Bdellovibrionales bacterium]|nr:NAD(P)H-hydrate dehydratase [Bdellovibrionales bacterium]
RGCLCSQSLTSLRDILSTFSAVVIGPGLGRGGEVEMFVREFLELAQSERIQAVIDADALRALPTSQGERVPLTRGAILTPHPGEAAFLLGTTTTEVQKDRFTAAERLLDATKATILLKGAGTIILNEEMGYVSLAGTPHLGTAGSGDVLSGVLGALIGQTGTALMATALGAYLHGKAAEYIFSNQTQGPFPASHLASAVSCVLGEHQRAR